MKQTNNITRTITKWVLGLAMMVLSWNLASAQTTVTIGSGTTTSSFLPIYTCYGYNYSQQIYTAAEMSAGGAISGGNITQIKFFYNSGGTSFTLWNNWNIYLGNTALNNFTGTTGWISTANLTSVFNGNIPTPVAGTWLTINLTTPFQWTGGNLVVAIDENTPNYSCTAAWRSFTTTAAAGPRSILYYSDGTNPNPAAPPTANYSTTTVRSQLQLTMTGGAACTGTPSPGNTVASAANVCLGSSVNLSLQNTTSGSGVSYQWQSGPSSSGPWTNFGGNFAGASASPTATTWYQCIVTCSNSSGTSNPVQVGINPFLSCYCASNATSTADEDISNVTLGTLNNSSSCGVVAPGPGSIASQYSNFTTSVTAPVLMQGATYPASVTMTSCGGSYGNKSRMWIDFNQSGTYDASELVLDGALTTGNHTATSTVNVPLNAILGTTGMRVVNVESSTVNACGTYTWGETEDYRVNIAPS
ncbi:MAG: GEVED domain-containing protein, partial [Bacteroidota bacterium]